MVLPSADLGQNKVFSPLPNNLNIIHREGSLMHEGSMEIKSGSLALRLGPNQTQKVIVKLYAAVPYAFAVVFPDKFICPNHCGLLQLKNFTVEAAAKDTDFNLVIKNRMESGKCLQFSLNCCEERDSWVNAFQTVSPSNTGTCGRKTAARLPKSNSRLPSLEEVSEEIEQNEENTILKSCKNTLSLSHSKSTSSARRRRRVVEAPCLEQISEEEEGGAETEDELETEMEIENRVVSTSSRRRSSLKDRVETRGGRSF